MKNKLILVMLLGILLIGNVIALDEQGTGTQGDNFTIIQTCNDATYITLDGILYPDKTFHNLNANMTKLSSGTFTYNFTNTMQLGRYDVSETSDGCEKTFAYYFNITPSGDSGSNNQIFFILFFVVAYGIGFFGFFGKNMLISFIGGIAMMFLGIFTTRFGIIVFRSDFTLALSYITLGMGFLFMIVPAVEYIQEQFG